MNTLLVKLNRFLKQILGLFPTPLPQGVPAFEEWVADLVATYSLPTSSLDDVRFVCAGEILRFGPLKDYCSKYRMVRAIRAVAAKQVAGNAFQDIKQRQKAANAVQPQ